MILKNYNLDLKKKNLDWFDSTRFVIFFGYVCNLVITN